LRNGRTVAGRHRLILLLRFAEGDGALVGGVDGFGENGAQAAFLHFVDCCRARATDRICLGAVLDEGVPAVLVGVTGHVRNAPAQAGGLVDRRWHAGRRLPGRQREDIADTPAARPVVIPEDLTERPGAGDVLDRGAATRGDAGVGRGVLDIGAPVEALTIAARVARCGKDGHPEDGGLSEIADGRLTPQLSLDNAGLVRKTGGAGTSPLKYTFDFGKQQAYQVTASKPGFFDSTITLTSNGSGFNLSLIHL